VELLRRIASVFSFRRISGQIAALVVISLVTIHLLFGIAWWVHQARERGGPPQHRHTQIETLARLVSTTAPADRPALLAEIARAFPQLELAAAPRDLAASGQEHVGGMGLPPPQDFEIAMFRPAGSEGSGRLGIRLRDGSMLTASGDPRGGGPPFFGGFLTTTLLFLVVCLAFLSVWAGRALSRPLSAFAAAAETFSLSGAAEPLPEAGPTEISVAARALNQMRARISALMQDRMRMLAAISHDLRTPITRLRLRAEFIEDDIQRSHMLRDLDHMRGMLDSVLSFLRDDAPERAATLVDLTEELHLVADQYGDLGHDVQFRGPAGVMVMARPDELHRAVDNLVGNAVRFGRTVEIVLITTPDQVIIDIADDGPGIDDARKAAMLEPFVRGDDARNMDDDTGFGLGLSIARTIVAAHGGELSLHDRKPHGLVARIALPRAAAARPAA
jgi:signal transduction histidine kinase